MILPLVHAAQVLWVPYKAISPSALFETSLRFKVRLSGSKEGSVTLAWEGRFPININTPYKRQPALCDSPRLREWPRAAFSVKTGVGGLSFFAL